MRTPTGTISFLGYQALLGDFARRRLPWEDIFLLAILPRALGILQLLPMDCIVEQGYVVSWGDGSYDQVLVLVLVDLDPEQVRWEPMTATDRKALLLL